MTNREYRNSLSSVEKVKWDNTYTNGHPLKDYIDWDAFLDSENGNELDFLLDKVEIAEDKYGRKVFILERYVEEDTGFDYTYVYIPEVNEFWKVPCPDDGIFDFESESPVEQDKL